ncbi:MAG TPA: hypothetical protein VK360_04860, partial [Acidimicrobiales bacterium]|nr:hypothetical protein [Acidimicrobiales bacterium]
DSGGERLERDDGSAEQQDEPDDGSAEQQDEPDDGGGEQHEPDDGGGIDDPDATVDRDGPGNADEPGADDTPAGPGAEEAEAPSVVAKVVASRSANGTTGNGAKPSGGSS